MIRLLTSLRKYWLSLSLLILTVITLLSLSPREELPSVPGGDKTHHLIAYFLLMLPTALRKPTYWPAIGLFFIGWSGAIELLQPYVNRHGEFQDWAANITGLVCSWLVVQLLKGLIPVNAEPK